MVGTGTPPSQSTRPSTASFPSTGTSRSTESLPGLLCFSHGSTPWRIGTISPDSRQSTTWGGWGFLLASLATGPGWSGYVMLLALMAITLTATKKARRANFERCWYTHHLFIIFFLSSSIHGAFCIITPDFAPLCHGNGVVWKDWMSGGFVYLVERVSREVRGRHKTYIANVIQHPSNV